jgi:hypothetical protein
MHELTVQERYDARGYMFLPQRQCIQCCEWRSFSLFGTILKALKDGTEHRYMKRRCNYCEADNKREQRNYRGRIETKRQ